MDKLFGGAYKGKKVLVTGHTGFKGSWLSFWLSELGADVVGYSIGIPTDPNHFRLLKPKITGVTGDVLDKKKILETIKKHKPDIVFHLAAQPIVRTSYLEPIKTLETNIMGTANVLESCRQVKSVKAIVVITSDKCYQNKEQIWGYRETDAMGGDDPYSASKGAADLVAATYRRSFFYPKDYGVKHNTLLATVRAGNVIGGGDWAKDRLIPDIMRATSRRETVVIRRPKATRPWQHVLEPLSGYLNIGWKLLEEKTEFADNWNFGPDESSSLSVEEVIHHTKKHWSDIKYSIENDSSDFHETHLLKLDSTKAHIGLKWKNVWGSDKTFEKTVNWYKEYYKNKKCVTSKDLEEYVKDAKRLSIEWSIT